MPEIAVLDWLKRLARDPWRDRVDWRYGSDTSGTIQMAELEVASDNVRYAYCYRGTLGWVIRRFLKALPVDPAQTNFVDFGSGKGRALLVASEFAFRRIIGVEFCEELHRTAEHNIARLPEDRRRRTVSLYQDVTTFDLPPGDLVAYIYNSFGPPVLDDVVAKLCAHRDRGYAVHVIYINPKHRDVLEAAGRFVPVFRHEKGLTYRVD
ncbi:MAG: hypothetical protein JSR60_01940 [Proteobacteria bacterium]|nr:hypothetical protein [Pseudomonadota bacterium]